RTTNADITLCAEGGTLTINQAVSAGAGTVRLHAAGAIGQSAAGVVTAAALGALAAGGAILLDGAINNVAVVALQAQAAGAAVDFRNATGFALGTVTAAACFPLTVTGIRTVGGDITLCLATGDLAINTPLAAGAGTV